MKEAAAGAEGGSFQLPSALDADAAQMAYVATGIASLEAALPVAAAAAADSVPAAAPELQQRPARARRRW